MPLVIGVLFLGDQIMGAPSFSSIGHQGLSFAIRVIHDFPSDFHILLGPHLPIFAGRIHRPVEQNFRSFGRLKPNVLAFVISLLIFGLFASVKNPCQGKKGD